MNLVGVFVGIFAHELDNLPQNSRVFLVRLSRSSAVLCFVVITILSLIPRAPDGSLLDLESHGLDDKVSHIMAYAALMGSTMWALTCQKARMRAFLTFFLYGIAMEIGQALMSVSRQGSAADALANVCGLLLGVWLATWGAKILVRFTNNE